MGQNSGFDITETLIEARPWRRLPGLAHGFSTRHVSRDEFFGRICDPRKPRPVLLKQVHSDRVHAVDAPPSAPPRGDALITATRGLALAIKTADCLPILLFDPVAGAAGAVHAGWRGTAQRITEKTVGALRAHYGAKPSRLRAAIGPGVHACCYQVGEEVLNVFRSQFPYAEELFRALEPENPADLKLPRQAMAQGHALMRRLSCARGRLDLEEANRRQLLDAGLRPENIVTGAPCTACRTDLLYSFRREGAAAGRLLALIALW